MHPSEHEMTAAVEAAAKALFKSGATAQAQRDATEPPTDDLIDRAWRLTPAMTRYRLRDQVLPLVLAALGEFAPLHEQRVRREVGNSPVVPSADDLIATHPDLTGLRDGDDA